MNVRRPGQGRPRVITAIQERYLRVSSLRQRLATARLLQNQLEQTYGVQISTQTIRNCLREYDLRPRVAARSLALFLELILPCSRAEIVALWNIIGQPVYGPFWGIVYQNFRKEV